MTGGSATLLARAAVISTALVALLSCRSPSADAVARTAGASVSGRVILVRGRPFFPVMLIDQCSASDVQRARRLGVNLILDEDCAGLAPSGELALASNGPDVVLSIKRRSVGGAKLVGWTYPDEPDNNGWSPNGLRAAFPVRAGTPDGLISFVTTTGGFLARAPYKSPTAPSVFSRFARLADVAGFDLYPLNHCQQDLSVVADAQRAFVRLASPAPTFQWIETGPIDPTYCGGFTMTPDELAAETWLAIIGGARGIGFFTHTFSPADKPFDVTPALQVTIARTSASIAALRPGLTGLTVPSGSNSGAIEVLARQSANATYVFAVNSSRGPVKAQLRVPSLRNGATPVFGETRSTRVTGGTLVDTFQPLGIHIYVQRR